MVNKALLKRMASEMSVGTIAEVIVEYAQGISEAEEVDDSVIETINAIETLAAEIKSRSASPKPKRSRRENKQEQPEQSAPEQTPQVQTRLIGNGVGGNNVRL